MTIASGSLRPCKKEASYSPKTYYLYDQGNIVCELDASGNCTKNNAFAPDGLYARYGGHSLGIYSFDHQGNVVRVWDGGGTDIRFSYNAWGQVNQIIPSYGWGSSFTNHTYNARWGYYRDGNGLYYCQHRYYDPANGRWVTRDPFDIFGGINIYGYCVNQPVLNADEEGTASIVMVNPSVGGTVYDHRYLWINTPDPCTGAKSAGFWPNTDRPRAWPPGYHGKVEAPDLHDQTVHPDDPEHPDVRQHLRNNDDPKFEKALWECVNEWKAKNRGGGAYFPGYACGSWADEMWKCAKKKLGW